MENLHSLLRRQIKKVFGSLEAVPLADRAFIDAVDAAYRQFDDDRSMLERSLDLSSRELLAQNSEMHAMCRAFPDIIFRLDQNGVILDLNGSRDSDLKYFAQKLPGKRVQDGLPIALGVELEKAIARAAATGEVVSLEYPLTAPSGNNCWETRIVRDGMGKLLMISRDITERVRTQEALKKSQEQLRQIQKMDELGRLAGGIAHDVNNLLTTILGLSEIILASLPAGLPLVDDIR
jgi:PAS domain-containing protein